MQKLSAESCVNPHGFANFVYEFCTINSVYHESVHKTIKCVHKDNRNMAIIKILYDRRNVASPIKPGTVEIEVYEDGKRKRFSTGVRVTTRQWRSGRVVNHPQEDELNAKIGDLYKKYQEAARQPGFELSSLSAKDNSHQTGFVDWLENEIGKRVDLRPNTIKDHKAMLNTIRDWGGFKTFGDLSRANVLEFDNYLRGRLRTQGSIHARHKALKVYIGRAIIQGLLVRSPYEGMKISKGQSQSVMYLTEEQRSAIEALELDGTIAFVRDMFLFACYTGLAFADMQKVSREDITEENGEMWLIDKRTKTGSRYRLMLLPEAQAILERYDYNLNRITNQKANVYLKGIAVAAGIKENLTMHMGRHTFATWALSKGVPIEVVSKMLAHADIATTQIYAKVLQKEVDKGFELLKGINQKD